MHFNQGFILDPCPLKGFPRGQEFKNWTNKYKGNKHRKQAGGQAKGEPLPGAQCSDPAAARALPIPERWGKLGHQTRSAEGRLHQHTLTPIPGHMCLARLLPTPAAYGSLATPLCDLGQSLPSLVYFLPVQ